MARNVEIKARIPSVAALEPRVRALAKGESVEIRQDDTFFACPGGRLKLRQFEEAAGELIYYVRPDRPGPKESRYFLAPTNSPATLREVLTSAYGSCGRVKKIRQLLMIGRTRVHLDEVEGLGSFLELEVVLADGESLEAGVGEANELIARLGLDAADLVEGAYVDLLARKGSGLPGADPLRS